MPSSGFVHSSARYDGDAAKLDKLPTSDASPEELRHSAGDACHQLASGRAIELEPQQVRLENLRAHAATSAAAGWLKTGASQRSGRNL